jgi:hypothetical protein
MSFPPEGSHEIPAAGAGDSGESSDPAALLRELLVVLCTRVAPALERIAAALEARSRDNLAGEADPAGAVIAALRTAIATERWAEVIVLERRLRDEWASHGEAARSVGKATDARRAAVESLSRRIEAARAAIDPTGVMDLYEQLAPLVAGDADHSLSRDLVRWLIGLVQRRLRGGTVRPDVVALATRIAAAFENLPEGASLKASLPTLRRSAGLCPQCGEPYTGLAGVCSRCAKSGALPPVLSPGP